MRKPRRIVENGRYHVIAKVNRAEFILQNDNIKQMLLNVITEAKAKYSFSVENFCIMDNHIHLMIRPHIGTSLSRVMQWILSVFAQRFNRIYGYKGHVWYDRFKSKVIADLRQFIATFSYIAFNPVKAGLVNAPLEYGFSGVRHLYEECYSVVDPPHGFLGLLFLQYKDTRLTSLT